MMRRSLFLLLLVAAVLAWGWALWRTGLFRQDRSASGTARRSDTSGMVDLSLVRDPFRGPWTPPDPPAVGKAVLRKSALRTLPVDTATGPLPKFIGSLGGEPPMAILGLDGRTEMVHAGSVAFGWTVTSVSAMGVDVERNGRRGHLAP